MSLFLPQGYAQLHFLSQYLDGPEQTFALAFHLIDPTIVDLEAAYEAWAEFGVNVGWPTEVQIVGIRAETGTADPTAPIVEEFFGIETGTGSNQIMPPNVSWLIKKQTGAGGRKNRGRVFMPHVLEDKVDGAGNVDPDYASPANAFFQDFTTAVAASIESDGGYLLHTDPGDAPTLLTGSVWTLKVATQRRRLHR